MKKFEVIAQAGETRVEAALRMEKEGRKEAEQGKRLCLEGRRKREAARAILEAERHSRRDDAYEKEADLKNELRKEMTHEDR